MTCFGTGVDWYFLVFGAAEGLVVVEGVEPAVEAAGFRRGMLSDRVLRNGENDSEWFVG